MSNLTVANLSVTGNSSIISQIAFGNTVNSISISSNGALAYKSAAINLANSFTFNNMAISPSAIAPSIAINAGISFTGINGGIVNTQIFAANGTWTKPSGLTGREQVFIMMWGAGGASGDTGTAGGGGGACFLTTVPLSTLTNTCAVVVGGLGDLGYGGNSTFAANSTTIFFAGGGSSANDGQFAESGGGGGWLTAGGIPSAEGNTLYREYGGQPLGGFWRDLADNITSTAVSIYGGGGGDSQSPGTSVFGGGGGTTAASGGAGLLARPHSIFGGAGGAGSNNTTSAYSVMGGDQGEIPGGGGWFQTTPITADEAGARGEVRVWILGERDGAVTLTYLGSNTSTSNSVVIPPQANVGDIAIFSDRMQFSQTGGAIGNVSVTPTGFTNILTANAFQTPQQWAWNLSYKQLEESDLNAAVAGMSDYTSMRKTISLFRPSRTPREVTAVSAGISVTTGTPTQRTITANTNQPWEGSILAVGYWDGSGAGSPTTTTSVEMQVINGPAANTVLEYKLYQQGDDTARDAITLNTNDTGSMTALAGFYLKVT